MSKLAEELRSLRARKHQKQEEVAAALSMSRQRYARLESGRGAVRVADIGPLAKWLGIPTDAVLGLLGKSEANA